MTFDVAALRRRARSGWVPAVLCMVAVVVALLANDVSAGEIARFAAYCVFGLVLPGLVLWRLMVPRAGSTLLADAVFGTTLALAVELVVYVVCAHVEHPSVARFWPLVPLVASVVPRWRPRIWRRDLGSRPVWWSWSLGGLMLLALAVLKQVAWDAAPLTHKGLSNPYVDIPYQLTLVGGLSRRVRTDLPFVQGEPMYYHWFTHAHLAAERHATEIEPIVLLSRLDMVIAVGLVLLGSAVLAERVAKSPLAGLVATGVLTFGTSTLIWPKYTPLFLKNTYVSPTTVFACVILLGCIAITLEVLDTDRRPQPTVWVAAALLVVASSGAKGSAVPVLLAGWTSVFLMALLLRRRANWRAAGLVAMGLVVFVAAQRIIYGGSSQGASVEPFGLGRHIAADHGLLPEAEGGSLGLRAMLTVGYVAIRASCAVALVGLFTPRVRRNPYAHFLAGSVLGGLGAVLVLDSGSRNQVYFMVVTPPFLAVVTGWGLVELVRRVPAPIAARVGVAFLGLGALASAVLLWPLRPDGFGDSEASISLGAFVSQPVVVVVLLILVWLTLRLVARGPRREAWRHAAPLACVSTVLGLGILTGPLHALDTSSTVPAAVLPSDDEGTEIGRRGIPAARWLRDHSAPDDVVATNSHCRHPGRRLCDHRAFWISAYVERQILLEGWAYTSRSAELAQEAQVSVPFLPYWKPGVLKANDEAFAHPTSRRLDRLRRDDVRWLFVDKRFPSDLAGLERLADLRLDRGDYAVFRLD